MSRKKIAQILFSLMAVAVFGYAILEMGTQTPIATETPSPARTRIPPPPSLDQPFFLPESSFAELDFDPDTYPDFASLHPDAACATWENGGITWLAIHEELGWLAQILLPEFRFCGIPDPYPKKPEFLPLPEEMDTYESVERTP